MQQLRHTPARHASSLLGEELGNLRSKQATMSQHMAEGNEAANNATTAHPTGTAKHSSATRQQHAQARNSKGPVTHREHKKKGIGE